MCVLVASSTRWGRDDFTLQDGGGIKAAREIPACAGAGILCAGATGGFLIGSLFSSACLFVAWGESARYTSDYSPILELFQVWCIYPAPIIRCLWCSLRSLYKRFRAIRKTGFIIRS